MSLQSSSDGKRFLESLILRAETILGKMIVKLTETHVPLEEMVPMINSVYGFVNVWEASLQDISLDHVLNGAGEFAADEAKSREERIMEQVNSLEERVEERGAAAAEGGRRSAVRHDAEAEPMFEFLEQSLNDYKPNKIGRCVISYVGRADRSFCMVDRDQRDCPKLMAAMQNSRGNRLTQLPPVGQVFGVYLDGSLFRAVRNKAVEMCPLKTAYIRLLDTGEVLPYDNTIILCDLSEYYRKLPAFAIRCMLVNVMDDPFCDDLNQYLHKNLHTNQHYKVICTEGSILSLKLSQQPIPTHAPKSPEKAASKMKTAKMVRILPPSPMKEPRLRLNIFKPEPVDQTSTASIRLAVVVPQPEGKHCCPFFDPVFASCAKGAHSKHDVIPVRNSQQGAVRVVPPIGCQVHLVTKFIKDVEHFWCHVVSPDFVDSDLLEMEMRMNAQENSMHFRKLDKPPYFAKRVFAKYVDKRWYRAEVAEYFNENNVLVFYVDYGNAELVRMEEIRQWDEKFSYLPYQAILCRLANIRRVKPNHKQAVVEMNRKLLNQRVLATIVNNGCPWEVTLYDKDGFDLSIGLVMAHLAKKITDDEDGNSSNDESPDAVAGA